MTPAEEAGEATQGENGNMDISNEAVEAAAWALDPRTMSSGGRLAEKFQVQTRAEARRILEAAAPYMQAVVRAEVAESNREHLAAFRDWKPGDPLE